MEVREKQWPERPNTAQAMHHFRLLAEQLGCDSSSMTSTKPWTRFPRLLESGGVFPTSEQECALERCDAGGETRPAAPESATDIGRPSALVFPIVRQAKLGKEGDDVDIEILSAAQRVRAPHREG